MSKDVEQEFDRQLEMIKEKSVRTSDVCITGSCIALSDPKVRAVFLEKLAEGNIFTGIHCEPSWIFEHVTVVMNFRCPDGVFCLIPPTFAAAVDLIGGTVTAIHDPYIAHQQRTQPKPLVNIVSAGGTHVGNG
jgi:hypothetical protein